MENLVISMGKEIGGRETGFKKILDETVKDLSQGSNEQMKRRKYT